MGIRSLGAFSLFKRISRKLSGDVKRIIRYHEIMMDWKFLVLVDAPQFAIVLMSMLAKKAASEQALAECLNRHAFADKSQLEICAFQPELVMLVKLIIIMW
uniref:Uncharacterized protein n=1 Tax=Spongospora subterranea TaxID=70186 RepID=A0A0H5R451_9EUKA|eukprot:CRZ02799.1 hypothetical protein [Spongospora subterranea]